MAQKLPPLRRFCVICEGGRGRMLICCGCIQYCHPECAQIEADDERLKELEETFQCPLCHSIGVEGQRNRGEEITTNRYEAAVRRKKTSLEMQMAQSSLSSQSSTGSSIANSSSRLSVANGTKPQSSRKRRASDRNNNSEVKKRMGNCGVERSGGKCATGPSSAAKKQSLGKKTLSSSFSNDTDGTPAASQTTGIKHCFPECVKSSTKGMICCDRCDQWFHFQCVEMTYKQAKLVAKYYCSACYKQPTFVTTYKSRQSRSRAAPSGSALANDRLAIEVPDPLQSSRTSTMNNTVIKKEAARENESKPSHKRCGPNDSLPVAPSPPDSSYHGSESPATLDIKVSQEQLEEPTESAQYQPNEELPDALDEAEHKAERTQPAEAQYAEQHVETAPQNYVTQTSGEESEDLEDYETDAPNGMYMRTSPGDTLDDRYYVIRKLGFGTFGTVWLCLERHLMHIVAVKITKAGDIATRNAREEVTQLQAACAKSDHPGRKHVIDLLDVFEVPALNGHQHVCTVFPVGESLLTYKDSTHSTGLLLGEVQRIMKEMLLGLDYLGTVVRLVHLDLKVENVLLMYSHKTALEIAYDAVCIKRLKPHYVSTYDQQQRKLKINKKTKKFLLKALDRASLQLHDEPIEEAKVCIADFGSAESIKRLRTFRSGHGALQTSHYRAPETVVHARGDGYGPSMDIWSAGCIAYELACGEILFKPRLREDGQEDDEDLLALMQEALGTFPEELLRSWSKHADRHLQFFTESGRLRNIKKLNMWPVEDVLIGKHLWHEERAESFGHFLRQLLQYDVTTRPSAHECLALEWLSTPIDTLAHQTDGSGSM